MTTKHMRPGVLVSLGSELALKIILEILGLNVRQHLLYDNRQQK